MRSYKVALSLVLVLVVVACASTVTVRSSSSLRDVNIAYVPVGDLDNEGHVVTIPSGNGAIQFDGVSHDGARVNGSISRTKLNSWAITGAAVGTLLALPALIFLGALAANPQWLLLSDQQAKKLSSGASLSYMRQSLSPWTIPITAIFAIIGTAPLLGLLKSHQVATDSIDLW